MKQDFRENLRLALDTLRDHKLRSFLAVLGVTIGITLVILVAGLVQGFRGMVQDEIMSYGVNVAWIQRFNQGPHVGRRPKEERERKPLKLADALALQTQCPDIQAVSPQIWQWEQDHWVRYQRNEAHAVEFGGLYPAYLDVYANASMKAGRFFTETEVEHRANVVDIGEDVAKALFPSIPDAVDKDILLDGSTFHVIGVLEKLKGGFGANDEDKRVFIPYDTFTKLYPAAYEIGIGILAYPGRLDRAADEAREVLRRNRKVPYTKGDDFSIRTATEAVAQFNDIIGMTATAIVVLSSIGLLIGGVGVMNIMLVSVTERTREIGVRMAIGARRSDITWQFLFEAMALTSAGGLIGILLGGGISLLLPVVSSLHAVVPAWAVIAGLVVSINVGLIFGVWPAAKAARLDPVEALRYE